MSIQKITQIFENLSNCTRWSLQLLNGRNVRGEFAYNAHDVVIVTSDAITEFMRELAIIYTKSKGKLSKYNEVCNYDGSAAENRIYKIEIVNELICESYEKLRKAMEKPDMQGNALEFPATSYVFKGNVPVDGNIAAIKLFTLINPFKVLEHAFAWNGESFKVLPDKYLLLRKYIDVLIIDSTAYLFNMNGEKLFNMERAYKTICRDKVEDIICSGIISDEDIFRQYATSGHNPRKFVAFDENRLQRIRNDEVFKNKMAEKFGIIQTLDGTFDSSIGDNVNRIVKFLCRKGMIDPADENPVEVEGARRWV